MGLMGDMLKFRQDDDKQCREILILFFTSHPNLEICIQGKRFVVWQKVLFCFKMSTA